MTECADVTSLRCPVCSEGRPAEWLRPRLCHEHAKDRTRQRARTWREQSGEADASLGYRPFGRPVRVAPRGTSIRAGVCQRCGRMRGSGEPRFHLHHVEYNDRDPRAHTVELCPSCHRVHHAFLRQRGGKLLAGGRDRFLGRGPERLTAETRVLTAS